MLSSFCSKPNPFKINSAPTVPVVTGTTTLCVGGTSRLSSDSLGGTWSSSDESIATVEPDGDVIAHAPGQVAIYYTNSNSDGCSSTKIITVTVYPIPTIEQITGIPSGGRFQQLNRLDVGSSLDAKLRTGLQIESIPEH